MILAMAAASLRRLAVTALLRGSWFVACLPWQGPSRLPRWTTHDYLLRVAARPVLRDALWRSVFCVVSKYFISQRQGFLGCCKDGVLQALGASRASHNEKYCEPPM